MEKTNKSLKEWNAVVEALGQGKQTIIIRKNTTNAKGFLLYPTFSYSLKDDYLKNFKKKHWSFVKENLLPHKFENKTEIKYFAEVENVVEKTPKNILSLNEYHIWNKSHVRYYLNGKKGYIWVLRVHELKKPYLANANRAAIVYANLQDEINLVHSKKVINDDDFASLIDIFKN